MISSNYVNSYMKNLAGLEGGHSPIGWEEKDRASLAQKHPITNTITSGIKGVVDGIVYTTIGVLAYPLATGWKQIVGSQADVCHQCYYSIKHITTDVIRQGADSVFYKLIPTDLLKKHQEVINAEPSITKTIASKVYGIVGGWSAWGQCQDDPSMLSKTVDQCREVNYIVGLETLIRDNYLLIGAAAVTLIALSKMYNQYVYEAKECQVEDALIRDLKNKYAKIALQIQRNAEDPKVQEIAQKILERESEINREVADLSLPNLNCQGVQEITEPVFVVAEAITQPQKY